MIESSARAGGIGGDRDKRVFDGEAQGLSYMRRKRRDAFLELAAESRRNVRMGGCRKKGWDEGETVRACRKGKSKKEGEGGSMTF